MKILQKYVFKQILLASAVVVLLIWSLMLIVNLLTELRDVGTVDYGLFQAIIHVFLESPHALYQFCPMLILLGCILGLGSLASHQELVIMRTSGFSTLKILYSTLIAAIFLIILSAVLGEWLAPKGFNIAEKRKQNEQVGGQAVATVQGLWLHQQDSFIHINRVMGVNHLEGVTRYQFNDKHQLLATYYVKQMDKENDEWLLRDVSRTRFLKEKTESDIIPLAKWDLALNTNLLMMGLTDPAEMPLGQLHRHAERLSQNGLRAGNYYWEYWKRVFQPLNNLLMVLLAVPFVMRTGRTTNIGLRVLFGVGVGFGFYLLNAFLGQFTVVYQISPMWAALFPSVIVLSIVLLLFARLRFW